MATAASYTDESIDDQDELAVNEGSLWEYIKAGSDLLTQDSDEILEMFCEHCEQKEGKTVKADGFCADCLEYMCSTCLKYHQWYKSDHTIQDSTNMPQDFCFQKCKYHPKELIKFYCMTCQLKACTICKLSHSNECKIEYIPSLVKSTDFRREVNEVLNAIDIDLKALSESQNDITSKLSDVQLIRLNAKASVREHTKSLKKVIENQYLDNVHELQQKQESEMVQYKKKRTDILAKLDKEKEELINNHQVQTKMLQYNKMIIFHQIERKEKELDKQSSATKVRDETRLKTLSSKSDKIEADLNNLKQNLSKRLFQYPKCDIFLAIKEAGKGLNKMKIDVKEASQRVDIGNYEFQPDDSKISKLDVNTSIGFGSFMEKTKIRFSKDVYTKHPLDIWSGSGSITGLCKISDTYLIAADYTNGSLKLIDIDRNWISGVENLKNNPFDVVYLQNNMAATTMPNAKKIQLLSTTQDNRMSLSSQIPVPDNCYGIAFRKPNIVVGCTEKIHVIGLNGSIINTITTPGTLLKHVKIHPIYGNVYYILENPSDDADTCILKTKIMTSDKCMKRSSCRCPPVAGLAVDKSGTIYTCTKDGNSILQLFNDFKTHHFHQVLPVLPHSLLSLFYCNKENKLYVGTESGIIRIFNVE